MNQILPFVTELKHTEMSNHYMNQLLLYFVIFLFFHLFSTSVALQSQCREMLFSPSVSRMIGNFKAS